MKCVAHVRRTLQLLFCETRDVCKGAAVCSGKKPGAVAGGCKPGQRVRCCCCTSTAAHRCVDRPADRTAAGVYAAPAAASGT